MSTKRSTPTQKERVERKALELRSTVYGELRSIIHPGWKRLARKWLRMEARIERLKERDGMPPSSVRAARELFLECCKKERR